MSQESWKPQVCQRENETLIWIGGSFCTVLHAIKSSFSNSLDSKQIVIIL